MTIEQIRESFKQGNLHWRKHALQRMFEREVSRDDVFACIDNGKIDTIYTDTGPYPAALIKGWDTQEQQLHVIIGFDESRYTSYIITVYHPEG